MEISTAVGFLAGALTALATIPQFLKSWKTKETKDVSLLWCVLLSAGVLLWTLYGLLTNDSPVIIANAVTLVFVVGILILKLKHG